MAEIRTIYKICARGEWDRARAAGHYAGSADDARDGFIHFSFAEQLAGTARKYFGGRDDLLLLAVEPGALGPALKLEASRGGQLFPHLYGPLPLSSVCWVEPLPWDGEAHLWPSRLAADSGWKTGRPGE